MSGSLPASSVADRLADLARVTDDGVTRTVDVLDIGSGALGYELSPDGAADIGVVLCPSFFELKTLQASELAFATELARSGFYALYVQAPGTGESFGEPEDVRVESRVSAAVAAARRALAGDSCRRIVYAGARLGGSVAILAAQATEESAFAVWDPVLQGSTYLKQARRLDRIASMAGRRKGYEGLEDQLERRGWATLLGNVVTQPIYDDLSALTVGDGPVVKGASLSVCLDDSAAGSASDALTGIAPALSSLSLGRRHLGHLGFSPEDATASIPLTLAWLKGSQPT